MFVCKPGFSDVLIALYAMILQFAADRRSKVSNAHRNYIPICQLPFLISALRKSLTSVISFAFPQIHSFPS